MERCRISVIIPVYNTERYLAEAIQSVLAQTLPPVEILVLDDGSTDGSADVARQFLSRIRHMRLPHRGPAATRNAGVQLACGQFLAFLDADDVWLPDKLALQMAAFAADHELDLVFGHVEQFTSPELQAVGKRGHGEVLPGHITSTMVVRRDVFDRCGTFDPGFQIACFSEWLMMAKRLSLKMATLPNVVARRRLHEGNLGRRKRHCQREYVQALKAHLDEKRRRAA